MNDMKISGIKKAINEAGENGVIGICSTVNVVYSNRRFDIENIEYDDNNDMIILTDLTDRTKHYIDVNDINHIITNPVNPGEERQDLNNIIYPG